MSTSNPKSIEEWEAYFAKLEGDELREKAIAANTMQFVRSLKEEEYSATEIHTIFILLARRFRETGQRSPGEGLYDLDALATAELPKKP